MVKLAAQQRGRVIGNLTLSIFGGGDVATAVPSGSAGVAGLPIGGCSAPVFVGGLPGLEGVIEPALVSGGVFRLAGVAFGWAGRSLRGGTGLLVARSGGGAVSVLFGGIAPLRGRVPRLLRPRWW